MKKRSTIGVAIVAVLIGTTEIYPQAERDASRPYELNLHAGGHWLDDFTSSAGPRLHWNIGAGAGARLAWNAANGLGVGGNVDWLILSTDSNSGDLDATVYLYSAEIDYTFSSANRTRFFVGAGVGAATFSLEGVDIFADPPVDIDETETKLMIPLAGGIKWFNRSSDPSWAIRVEARDNVMDQEDDTTHNIEVSAGVSFLFGGT